MAGVRKFDEDEVLASALEAFSMQGFAGTSMPELARKTGVQRGSLYNAYGSREAIFLQAFDLYAQSFLTAARKSLEHDDAGEMLRRFFQVAVENMAGGTPARGCLTTKTAIDGSLSSRPIKQKVRGLLKDLFSILETALARPAIAGQLALDPAKTAELIVTFTRGLAVIERIHGDRKVLLRQADDFIAALVRQTEKKRAPAASLPSKQPSQKKRHRSEPAAR